jgi:hypothetical protein
MTRTTGGRRTAAALTLLATTFGGAVALVESSAATATAPAAAPAAANRTTLTFQVPDCTGCKVQLHQGLETDDPADPVLWDSKVKKVDGGEVSFTVRSRRTQGMSVTVDAPWEGHTGYETTVAFRYRGEDLGDAVTFREARRKKRASACWEGTRRDEVTIPLTVREVMVEGVHERVRGSIAFVRETQAWLSPMRRAPKGVLGSQDVNICH